MALLQRTGDSLPDEAQNTIEQSGRRTAELIQKQMVRRAEQRRLQRGNFDGLASGGGQRQMLPRLKEHSVEHPLQLSRLQRVDAVASRKEGDHEWDPKVRHGEVREEQLCVVRTEAKRRRAQLVLSSRQHRSECGHRPQMQHVIFGLHAVW
jgi:hypothetical protein